MTGNIVLFVKTCCALITDTMLASYQCPSDEKRSSCGWKLLSNIKYLSYNQQYNKALVWFLVSYCSLPCCFSYWMWCILYSMRGIKVHLCDAMRGRRWATKRPPKVPTTQDVAVVYALQGLCRLDLLQLILQGRGSVANFQISRTKYSGQFKHRQEKGMMMMMSNCRNLGF